MGMQALRNCVRAIAWNVTRICTLYVHFACVCILAVDVHQAVIQATTLLSIYNQGNEFQSAWLMAQVVIGATNALQTGSSLARDHWTWWHARRPD